MKLFQKKKNNKGFSLVELIVAVAIMAVLMGVLIPTLIRYVEKSKKQKDESAIEEIRYQMELVMAGDADFAGITGTIECTGATVTLAGTKLTSSDNNAATVTEFLEEVSLNLGEADDESIDMYSYKYSSKHAGSGTTTVFTVADGKVTVVIDSDKYGEVKIPASDEEAATK